jgi:calcium-dependent protein kinase
MRADVAAGVPPFYGETESSIFQEVLTGELDLTSNPWPSVSKEAKNLVNLLLVRDPSK